MFSWEYCFTVDNKSHVLNDIILQEVMSLLVGNRQYNDWRVKDETPLFADRIKLHYNKLQLTTVCTMFQITFMNNKMSKTE